MRREEFVQALKITFAPILNGARVAALEFEKHLWLVRGLEVSFGMMKPDQIIRPAVRNEQGHLHTRKLAHGVVVDVMQFADRQPREQLAAEIRNAGEGVLKDQPANRFAQRELGGHAAAEGFAERDDVPGRESLLPQPREGRLRVEVGAGFVWRAFTLAVAAVVKEQDVHAEFQPGLAEVQTVADVAGVAVEQQQDEMRAGRGFLCGEKPSVQPHSIGGRKGSLLKWTAQQGGAVAEVAVGRVNLPAFKPSNHCGRPCQSSLKVAMQN